MYFPDILCLQLVALLFICLFVVLLYANVFICILSVCPPVLLFDRFCHVQIGELSLALGRAGAGELLPLVGTVQVSPHSYHLYGDLKATILLGYNLRGKNVYKLICNF